jgi:lysophospholipase L1-like esterase
MTGKLSLVALSLLLMGVMLTTAVSAAPAPAVQAKTQHQGGTADCDNPVRIMPLGDSITRGDGTGSDPFVHGDEYGYRYYLFNALVAAGYNFDFVGGERHGGLDGLVFDYDHEGHAGYRADWIANRVDNYLNRRPADVILLHIGTNDIAQGQGDSPVDIENILTAVDQINEAITVIVARIIDQNPTNPNYQSVTSFNDNVAAMVQSRITNGDKIVLVDMQSALTYPDDMHDWLHPNDFGYIKMAAVWFAALQEILPHCPPHITSLPTDSALVDQPYSYLVTADGFPPPEFAFANTPPDGMTIDAITGLVQWTPTAVHLGQHTIAVQASNVFGTDTQIYLMTVAQTQKVYLPLVGKEEP